MSRYPVQLGFIPLTDAAPVIVARALGYFADEGLDVSLSREASWATVRDKMAAGVLDGAHMLGPAVLAMSLGLDGPRTPMIAPLALNRGGAAITLCPTLVDGRGAASEPAEAAAALKRTVEARRLSGRPPLTLAVVYPFSMHNYLLRGWLADASVTPDEDVRIPIVAPPRMVERLAAGEIDGCCVGAPWPDLAADQGHGQIVARAPGHGPGGSDKVFAVRERWGADHPDELQALLRALIRAAAWADAPEHRAELAECLADFGHLEVEPRIVAQALADGGLTFHRDGAAVPDPEQAAWFVGQMIRWNQGPITLDMAAAVARRVYRPHLLRAAYSSLRMPWPDGEAG